MSPLLLLADEPATTTIMSSSAAVASAVFSMLTLLANIVFFILTKRSSKNASDHAAKAVEAAVEANKHAVNANAIGTEANVIAGQNNLIASGHLEADLSAQIREAQAPVQEMHRRLVELEAKPRPTKADDVLKEGIRRNLRGAVEAWLTQIEIGCRLFLSKKYDSDNFRKNYFATIRQIVMQKDIQVLFDLLHPRDISHFSAIWSVYDQFRDPM